MPTGSPDVHVRECTKGQTPPYLAICTEPTSFLRLRPMYILLLYFGWVMAFQIVRLAGTTIGPNHYEMVSDANPKNAFWYIENGTDLLWPVPIRRLPSCSRMFVGKLVYSSTPKSNSRQMKKMLCELLLRKLGMNITKDVEDDLTTGKNWCLRSHGRAKMSYLKGWENLNNTKMFVWRDPVDRFVSMYGHVCISLKRCGKAGESIHTAAKAFYEYLQFGTVPKGAVTPEFFVHHISPTSWSCDIGAYPTEFVPIAYSKKPEVLIKRLRRVFRKVEAPRSWIEKALRRLKKTTTNKARLDPKKAGRYDRWMREVRSNPTTMSYVLATYYHDYRLWNKRMPTINKL
ncbi:unnamed protein product, partial [Mesorhabditis spiculigera]